MRLTCSEHKCCSEHESYLFNDMRRRRRLLLSQQLRLQARNLPLKLPQHGILGILIDARLVGDVLGSVGIAQRAQRLLIVVACWSNVGNHDRLSVATQRVLQQWTAMSSAGWQLKPPKCNSLRLCRLARRSQTNTIFYKREPSLFISCACWLPCFVSKSCLLALCLSASLSSCCRAIGPALAQVGCKSHGQMLQQANSIMYCQTVPCWSHESLHCFGVAA